MDDIKGRGTFAAAVAALVAALVGFGGTLALLLAAASAVGARPAQTASLLFTVCLGVALTSAILSWRLRMPVITAWSTPGLAVIAAFAAGIGMERVVGAVLMSAVLVMACAAIRPLGALVARLPMGVAAAMLAGVLVRFVMALADNAAARPALVLPLVALFFLARQWSASAAVLCVLVAGTGVIFVLGLNAPLTLAFVPPHLEWIAPHFDLNVMLGLGIPLFLVTMAAQNLPGLAVLRAAGYHPPPAPLLAVTGFASLLTAPFGSPGVNLAAITAAICAGPDAHPDPARRYLTGLFYCVWYLLLAASGASLAVVFAALPSAFIATVAGLALLAPLTGALSTALASEQGRLAAVATFATTASGVVVMGIGAPVWGLAVGLAILALERLGPVRLKGAG